MIDELLVRLMAAIFCGSVIAAFIGGIIAGQCKKDQEWTQYVIENGAMEWHCDSKTGETVLRWKE